MQSKVASAIKQLACRAHAHYLAKCAANEYIVQRGDNPSLIAKRHGVKLADFMKANNLNEESAKKLRVGQRLTVPPRVVPPEPQLKTPVPQPVRRKLPTAQQILDLRKRLKTATEEQIPGLVDEAADMTYDGPPLK